MIKSSDIIIGLKALRGLTKKNKKKLLNKTNKVECDILAENDLQELLRLVIDAIMVLRTFTILPEDEQLIKNRIEFFSTLKDRVIKEIERRKKQ
jgi:hypothetical protein